VDRGAIVLVARLVADIVVQAERLRGFAYQLPAEQRDALITKAFEKERQVVKLIWNMQQFPIPMTQEQAGQIMQKLEGIRTELDEVLVPIPMTQEQADQIRQELEGISAELAPMQPVDHG
jgi:bifunctional DNase/RNase